MDAGTDSDLDIQAHCRSLALQQIGMLTRIAEIGMRLVEAEGAKAIAQAEQPEAEAPGAEPPAAKDHGLAFARHAGTVQRALMQRARAAADLCARDRAARRARRARQRNHVTEALYALIWDPAQSIEELDEADHRTGMLHERLDALYEDEEDRIEDRPVGAVITGLACGLGLSDEWRRRAADWSGPPYPPPPTGSPGEIRARRRARLHALMKRTLGAIDPAKAPGLEAGMDARLQEPDAEELIDTEPPARAAARLCRSLGVDFAGDYEEPPEPHAPDTG
ncbi:hypothetical protein [Inquilinus sp. Marseille-Q2685]|uniref:hypothetical protein n=1 Tax=Inquilinus sp. Marseille-Q2685 TaxID=2866581 RepID=UPI001CE3E525|nr:hypothetical protein [Inquilinus sp. Marseille-Q2685]